MPMMARVILFSNNRKGWIMTELAKSLPCACPLLPIANTELEGQTGTANDDHVTRALQRSEGEDQ